ncbi:MAG: DNA-binding domain-containing protein [Xanthobacteraceae bacterium]|nr:DNA-binding domain-containing protein [Xanthobacteraceae bacterium]
MFAPLQARFATALLDPGAPVPEGVVSHTGAPPVRRFAVYRNNVVVSLIEALRARFPAVARIVGPEFFAAMARLYAAAHPPASPVMMWFGEALPEFLASFPPARELPYLPDVARLEAAHTRAYHAADAAPVDPARFAALGEAAGAARVALHPSAAILRSAHPVVTIWAMNTGATPLAPIADWRGEDALVMRPALDVEVRALPPGGAAFLEGLAAGAPLAAAIEAGLHETAEFDVSRNLAGLIGAGLAVDLLIDATTGTP